MIDIHHHLLYGLDDGAKDFETSLKMAEIAIDDGITHVVCTPHANSDYTFRPEENAALLAELQQKIGDRLTLGLGCDFHLSFDNIEDALAHPTKYTVNGKRYLLVEFPDFGIPQNISASFYEMAVAGIVPILTHPERNLTLMQKPEKLAKWLRMDCLVQVTAGSLVGGFGKRSAKNRPRTAGLGMGPHDCNGCSQHYFTTAGNEQGLRIYLATLWGRGSGAPMRSESAGGFSGRSIRGATRIGTSV